MLSLIRLWMTGQPNITGTSARAPEYKFLKYPFFSVLLHVVCLTRNDGSGLMPLTLLYMNLWICLLELWIYVYAYVYRRYSQCSYTHNRRYVYFSYDQLWRPWLVEYSLFYQWWLRMEHYGSVSILHCTRIGTRSSHAHLEPVVPQILMVVYPELYPSIPYGQEMYMTVTSTQNLQQLPFNFSSYGSMQINQISLQPIAASSWEKWAESGNCDSVEFKRSA